MSVSSWRRLETDKAENITGVPRPLLSCPKRSINKPALSDLATMVGTLGFLSACMGGGSAGFSGGIGNLGGSRGTSLPSPAMPLQHQYHFHSHPVSDDDSVHLDFNGGLEEPTVIGTKVTVFTGADDAVYEWFRSDVPVGNTGSSYELMAEDIGTVLSVEVAYTLNGEVQTSLLEQPIGYLVEGQAIAGEVEEVGEMTTTEDIHAFAHQGNFIDSGKDGISIVNIESVPDASHDEETEVVFKAYAPKDLHDDYRQIFEDEAGAVISDSEVFGATIIVVPSDAQYDFRMALTGNEENVIVLISAGNEREAEPLGAKVPYYQDYLGSNIFFVGGYDYSDHSVLDPRSAEAGQYQYAYISGQYAVMDPRDISKELAGTSFAVQEVAAKLAVLYEALNENNEWSLKDAMALLMTSRSGESFVPNLNDFLVAEDNGEIYVDDFGKTHLLDDGILRAMVEHGRMLDSNLPPDSTNMPDYYFSTLSFTSDSTADSTSDLDDIMMPPMHGFNDFLPPDGDLII